MLTPYDLGSVSPGTRLRARLIEAALERHKVDQVLDCGCGVGILAKRLSHAGINVVGFDINPELVFQAAFNNSDGGFFVGHIEHLPFRSGTLSGITAADVIEHLPEVKRGLGELARALVPGGKVVITTPNHNFERIFRLLGVAQVDIGHYRTFSRAELEAMLDGLSLEIAEHSHVCNPGVAGADAIVARLAIMRYGKQTVKESAMALDTSSSALLSWAYYLICRIIYPVLCALECVLPSSWGTENLIVLSRLD